MKIQQILLIALTLLGLAGQTRRASANLIQGTSPLPKVVERKELPDGGKFFTNPCHTNVAYYLVPQWVGIPKKEILSEEEKAKRQDWRDFDLKEHPDSVVGLYQSTDSGQHWKHIAPIFRFRDFLIHPDTGKLFATISVQSLQTGEGGSLRKVTSTKIITSDDEGLAWKEVNTQAVSGWDISSLIPDPDNFGRICFSAWCIRSYVFQSKDANYSQWEQFRAWDWPKGRAKNLGF